MDDNTKPPQGDPADIFNDLAALRKASKLTVKRQIVLVNVPVGRPANNVYFRTHKDIKLEDATVTRDEEGGRKAFYFIVPAMRDHPKLAPRLRYVTIRLVCTWPGDGILLWPVPARADFAAWRSEQAAATLDSSLLFSSLLFSSFLFSSFLFSSFLFFSLLFSFLPI